MVKGTIKQQIAAKKIAESEGKEVGKAMLEAGYSKSVAKNPKILTNSKAWPALLEKNIPDALVSKQHKKLLTATDIHKYEFDSKIPDEEIRGIIRKISGAKLIKILRMDNFSYAFFTMLDNRPIAKAIDMAYKLKNKYPSEKSGGDTNIAIVNVIQYGEKKPKRIEAENVDSVAEV